MKKLEKIISLLLKIIDLLPILIEFLKALDHDTTVIQTKLDSLDIQIEDIKQVTVNKVPDAKKQVLDENTCNL